MRYFIIPLFLSIMIGLCITILFVFKIPSQPKNYYQTIDSLLISSYRYKEIADSLNWQLNMCKYSGYKQYRKLNNIK